MHHSRTRRFPAPSAADFTLAAIALAAAIMALCPAGGADPAPTSQARLIASPEPGWPQWRGPRRDGVSDEKGLLDRWPEGGPPLLWKTNGLGRGYSAPIITRNRMFLTGDLDEELHVFALDLAGRRLWTARNGRAWKTPYPGARAACTFSEGRIYNLNAHGRLACFEAATGQEVWSTELFERFGGRNPTWAVSEGVLVDGPRVLATVGGSDALMVALDKRTGATIWKTPALRFGPTTDPDHERLPDPAGDFDNASYAAPILFELGGRRHIVGCSTQHLFGVDAESGELLWTRPLRTRYSVIAATPVLVGNAIFITAPDTESGGLLRLRVEGRRVHPERVWSTSLDTCHGGLVAVGPELIGSWYRRSKGWASLDVATGTVRHETRDLAMGSVLYADGRLYCLGQDGEMALLATTPRGFEFMGRFRHVPDRQSDVWTHPVILDGRLYLRYHETLSCYGIRPTAQSGS